MIQVAYSPRTEVVRTGDPRSYIVLVPGIMGAGGGGPTDAVRYGVQTLSAPQQLQARTNIGAAAASHGHSLASITQSGATNMQVPRWDDAANGGAGGWEPATIASGGGGPWDWDETNTPWRTDFNHVDYSYRPMLTMGYTPAHGGGTIGGFAVTANVFTVEAATAGGSLFRNSNEGDFSFNLYGQIEPNAARFVNRLWLTEPNNASYFSQYDGPVGIGRVVRAGKQCLAFFYSDGGTVKQLVLKGDSDTQIEWEVSSGATRFCALSS